MTFIERFHAILTSTDPRPLVREMHPEGVVEITRPELAAMVGRARGGLSQRGVQPGDRVVHVGPNRATWVAVDLATLFEGAIAVPLYARQAPDELVAMMHDCDPALVVVADDALAEAITALWPEAPVVTWEALLLAGPKVSPPAPRGRRDVVTLVYTSGTSGTAKGAMITVANVDHMLPVTSDALTELMGDDSGHDRVFHYLPCCFMGSRVVLWTTLLRETGITLSTDLERLTDELPVAAPNYFLNVPILLERIRNGVDAAMAARSIPVHLLYRKALAAWGRHAAGAPPRRLDAWTLQLAENLIFSKVRRRFGPNLRFLICGSAPLGADTQRWFEMIGVPVYQVYGLTETTAIVTMDQPGRVAAGHVGFPVDGCEVALGEGDELLVRGPHVFPGYWNRPDATAEALRDRWFHTGDQCAVDAEGRLAVVGRVKNLLVPSSGHNVAPEPLEQKLVETIRGAEQVVLVGHGRPYLVALVAGAVAERDVGHAVTALNEGLPHYKRVKRWKYLGGALTHEDGLLTANGKLRRSAIEARYADEIEGLYR